MATVITVQTFINIRPQGLKSFWSKWPPTNQQTDLRTDWKLAKSYGQEQQNIWAYIRERFWRGTGTSVIWQLKQCNASQRPPLLSNGEPSTEKPRTDLYKSLLRAILRYGAAAWGYATESGMKQLQSTTKNSPHCLWGDIHTQCDNTHSSKHQNRAWSNWKSRRSASQRYGVTRQPNHCSIGQLRH
jgi:hypothetical protein